MKTEAKPTPKPAPHVLETMALKFEINAAAMRLHLMTKPNDLERLGTIIREMTWLDAAQACRDALKTLQEG